MPDLRQACATGKSAEDTAPADALVRFGAMEDLAHKKIFPSLPRGNGSHYSLQSNGEVLVIFLSASRFATTRPQSKALSSALFCRQVLPKTNQIQGALCRIAFSNGTILVPRLSSPNIP